MVETTKNNSALDRAPIICKDCGVVYVYRDRVSHITEKCSRLLLNCECGKRFNLKDMRRHLNNDCSKVIRSKFMSDKVCEARVLDNLEAMVEEHVSSKASLMLKKLGKILFPMPANDYLHTGDGHVMWTKCNDRYV